MRIAVFWPPLPWIVSKDLTRKQMHLFVLIPIEGDALPLVQMQRLKVVFDGVDPVPLRDFQAASRPAPAVELQAGRHENLHFIL